MPRIVATFSDEPIASVSIIDFRGVKVKSYPVSQKGKTIVLDTNGLIKGVYLITIYRSDGSILKTKKIHVR